MTAAALLLVAATAVFRVEVDEATPTLDGTPAFAVGVDGVRRPVVLLSVETYEDMTRKLERANGVESVRVLLHGRRVNTRFTPGKSRVTTYADGYSHEEKLEPVAETVQRRLNAHEASEALRARARERRRKMAEARVTAATSAQKQAAASSAVPPAPDGSVSERHRRFRLELEKSKNRSVTVIHDAVTGKDKVIE